MEYGYHVTDEGNVLCTKCDQLKFITDFYLTGSTYICIDDIWYGKPRSWCKVCHREYNRSDRSKEVKKVYREKFKNTLPVEEELSIENLSSLFPHLGPPPPT